VVRDDVFVKRAGAHVAVRWQGRARRAEPRLEGVGAAFFRPDLVRELRVLRVVEGVFRGGPDLVADGVEPLCILGLRG